MNESIELVTGTFTGTREEREGISPSEDVCDVSLNEHTSIRPLRSRNARMIQNFLLVWLDSSINQVNDNDCCSIIMELQQVVTIVNAFANVDECIDFITDIKEEKIFLILSEIFVQTIVPVANEIPQIISIYIFPGNKSQHEKWSKQWRKMKGMVADIKSMSEELKKAAQECEQNSVSISFVTSEGKAKQDLNQLDQSFMYTQIMKEIFLTIDFHQQHIDEFLIYCREQFHGNNAELKNVDKIEKEYHHQKPIWWYTYDCFLYSMVNRALRTMEVDLIIKMGFFVRDLHNHIAELHTEQYGEHHHSDSFAVYRGQGLSCTDFEQLMKTKGGLMSFNSFLSTTLDRNKALAFAESNQCNHDLVGILFKVTVNSSIASTPFADIRDASYFQEEEEILFSMHSVFRIGHVKQIDKNDRLWQVDLTLTSENDPELHALTEYMRKESFPHQTGWYRLGSLLLKVAQFDKAEEVFEIMLRQTSDESEKANIFHMLGIVKYNYGKYAEAVEFYEKSIEIMQKILPPTHPDLAASYRNIGTVYDKMGEYSKALSYHEKALESYQNTITSNHFIFSGSDDNSNLMNETTDDCSKAILSSEKALEILETTLPTDNPSLATFYDRYGSVYEKMGNHSKARSFYGRALRIKEKHLPSNHPSLATSCANLGVVYEKMGDLSTAHSFHQRALNIGQCSLPANHPDLQVYRQNIENGSQEP
jgi:tetratricopeptide (TPR) repeat protein